MNGKNFMKNLRKSFKVAAFALALAGAGLGITSCSGGTSAASIQATYVNSVTTGEEPSIFYNVYQLHLMSNNTYELVETSYCYGWSMNLANYIYETTGTYTVGASEDGYTAYTLGTADRVILNAFSLVGGFNISIDTATTDFSTQVELPAASEGEKIYATSAQDVIDKYGQSQTVYISDTNNTFSLTNPNA